MSKFSGGFHTDKNFKKHQEKRAALLKAHEEGKLSKSFYSVDKKTGKKYLSPHQLWREGM